MADDISTPNSKPIPVIVSSSNEINGALSKFFTLFREQMKEPEIVKLDESFITEIKKQKSEDCFMVLASDQPDEQLQWLYKIRCIAKFRGPCAVIIGKDDGGPEVDRFQRVFETFMEKHQSRFDVTELFKFIGWIYYKKNHSFTVSRASFARFRRMQRKIRGLYLPIKHE